MCVYPIHENVLIGIAICHEYLQSARKKRINSGTCHTLAPDTRKTGVFPDHVCLNVLRKKRSNEDIPSHLRLVKGNVCPRRDVPLSSLRVREELLGLFLVGFPVGIIPFCGFFFCMDAKEAVHRVFPSLTEIVFLVLTFVAPGDMGREKMGEVDLPEVGVDLPLFEEFFYVPWRILHGNTSLFRASLLFLPAILIHTYCTKAIFISISKKPDAGAQVCPGFCTGL